jgi:tRNA-2-methylthio-N6-dimethylallyladenosine synthase
MNSAVKIYLDSYGCQMNVYDGELVASLLRSDGYALTSEPEEASVILINTCAVREHAEQRALGRLRSLGSLKKTRPELVLGVLGCMAEEMRESVREKVAEVDLVAGPDSYRQLPVLIGRQLNGSNGRLSIAEGDPHETFGDVEPSRREGVNAFVAIMRGCNNFCSYCIVPYVRGRERSRHPDEIAREVVRAVRDGYPEVTLLGQNVNSYRWEETDFPELLGRIAVVPGLRRLRFMTSHPRDLSDALIERLAEGGTVCPSLHLPVQAGSDRILEKMNRGYTRQEYLDKVKKLREAVPGLSLTTDLLCGFPTETEEDFRQTLDLIEEARFDDAFTFRYSVRPGTAAAKLPDDVPEEVKIERLERMIALCRKLADVSRREMIGREVEVLLENPSPKSASEWIGHTECGRVALVPGQFQKADFVKIRVEDLRGFSLWGRPVG